MRDDELLALTPGALLPFVLAAMGRLGGAPRRKEIVAAAVQLAGFSDEHTAVPTRYRQATYGGHVETLADYAVWHAGEKGWLESRGDGRWALTRAGSTEARMRTLHTLVAAGLGRDYVAPDERAHDRGTTQLELDLNAHERALRSHSRIQNRIAELLPALGLDPRSPTANEPQYDLLGWSASRLVLIEVKSLPDRAEEQQLRLGLGQVLRYRHQLEVHAQRAVQALLAVERPPNDASWRAVIEGQGVALVAADRDLRRRLARALR